MRRLVLIMGTLASLACSDSSADGGTDDLDGTGTSGEDDVGDSGTTTTTTGTTTTATTTDGECVDGETQPCYPGPEGTQDVGVCAAGTQSCVNGQWQSCEGATVPADVEGCDGLDDDCDGIVDNACVEWQLDHEESSAIFDLAIADNGDVFVAGVFWGGDFVLGDAPLVHQGDWDVFLARFAADGTHLWSTAVGGGADEDEGRGVALDGAGNVYVTGSFWGDAVVEGEALPTLGGTDLFVAKYSVEGEHLWTQRYGSTGREVGYDVAADAAGPVVGGSFSMETDLGDGPVVSAGEDDVFLLRLDPEGTPLWSRTAGSDDLKDDHGWAVAMFPNGDVLFGGSFAETIDLGGGELVTEGAIDMFLARYSGAEGMHLWSLAEGGGGESDAYGVDVDADGNIVVGGRGGSTPVFGLEPLGGNGQAVVAKLDGDGNGLWARRSAGGFGEDYATAMAVAAGPGGELFAAGYFNGDIDFGDGPDTDLDGSDIETYIVKFDADGSYLWGYAFGTDDTDYGWAVAAGADGRSVYGGSLYSFEGRMFMVGLGPDGR